jgi:AGZA family xanthine/uracil permease-like MFS transporter
MSNAIFFYYYSKADDLAEGGEEKRAGAHSFFIYSERRNYMEKFFKLKEHDTTVKTEIIAGITTFMTMAYILVVNPGILASTGMPFDALFTSTVLASIVATLVMALYANYPFALAPGMGLNAFFAFTVVGIMGYSWQFALTAVLIEGIIFIILTFLNVREAIINAIPMNLKHAVSVGIGLFIAFIGLNGAGIVVTGQGTPLMLGEVNSGPALVAILGLLITGVMLAKKVKGALLWGIIITTAISVPVGLTSLPSSLVSLPPSIAPIAFQFDFTNVFSLDMLVVLFTFLFVDMFDTIGTLIGVSVKADLLDESGKLPGAKKALFADAIGTTVGACLGTSTVTTFVESAAGVADGGRTGLTALSTAGMFFIALFLSPLFLMVPAAATSPALILVGLFMMSPILKINLDDYTESIPAFLTIIMMPLAYSIAEGIAFGVASYMILKFISGRAKEVSMVTYIVGIIFILRFMFIL